VVNKLHPNESPGMDRTREFGEMLRTLREERKLTQEDLAELIERSVQSVSKLERGLTFPKLETLIRLSEKLNVPLRELVEVFDPAQPIDADRVPLETSILQSTRRLSLRDLEVVDRVVKAFPQDH